MGTDLDDQMEVKIDDEEGSAIEIEDDGEEEEEYVVEEIIKHRITRKGKLEYFLKWKGFTDADNTWEPAENLNCPGLVNVYETERKKKFVGPNSATKEQKKGKKRKSTGDGVNGFEKGFTAKEIVGATEEKGKVYFLIKWTDRSEEDELVPASVVNVRIPQMVIAFYEARLAWSTVNTLGEEEDEDEEDELDVENVEEKKAQEIDAKAANDNDKEQGSENDEEELENDVDDKEEMQEPEKAVDDEKNTKEPEKAVDDEKNTQQEPEKAVNDEKDAEELSDYVEKENAEKGLPTVAEEDKLPSTSPPLNGNSEIDVT